MNLLTNLYFIISKFKHTAILLFKMDLTFWAAAKKIWLRHMADSIFWYILLNIKVPIRIEITQKIHRQVAIDVKSILE